MKEEGKQKVVVINNFSEQEQEIRCWLSIGLDRLTNYQVDLNGTVVLSGYQSMWVELGK